MPHNPHIEYEKLVQDVYQTLHEDEGIDTIKVEHNKRIEGKSGCKHQVDIYWEFGMVGETYRVAIECKNYAEPVEIGKLRDFFGVLHDVGNVNGIFISKVGFDSGAVRFADYYDISLREVRVPVAEDWRGRVKDIHLSLTAYATRITNTRVVPDRQWLVAEGKMQAGARAIPFPTGGWNHEMYVYDGRGDKVANFLELEKELPRRLEEELGLVYRKTFDDGYLDMLGVGRTKIEYIEFVYDVVSTGISNLIEGEEIAKAILKDVKTGKFKFFDNNGKVRHDL